MRRQSMTFIICGLALLYALILVIKDLGYGLTYQVSTSMPMGWYYYKPIQHLQRGDWISLTAPDFAERYLQQHHLVPHSGILIKAIAALPGDFVCQQDLRLMINHRIVATLLTQDRFHQAIVKRPFCQYLAKDQYLVLGISDAKSYDSRYFGPVVRSQILAQAVPLSTLLS